MRKILATIAVFAILLSFTSAHNANDVDTKIDAFAPNFKVSNKNTELSLSELRGNYVLVNFWSSDNADSRIRNIEYDRFTNNNDAVSYVSINFDDNSKLFQEVLKNDRINSETQFHLEDGKENEEYKRFHLENGFNSFLISREGKIMAVNPSKQKLTELLCQ